MKVKTIPIFIILIALIGACAGFDPQAFVPGIYTSTPLPSREAPTLEIVEVAPAIIATGVIVETDLKVCTNVAGGKLHVRIAPGDTSDVRGYLLDGESVTPGAESRSIEGSLWLKLSSPIEGWVNAKYLCEFK
jgi:hypothetical protein